jgi:hypothetical protein
MASPGTLDAGLMVCFRALNLDTRMSGGERLRSNQVRATRRRPPHLPASRAT